MSEIIIDGVDVAGCDMKCTNSDCGLYYAEVYNTSDELKYGFKCEDNPDCYYKQLQRLQQENEELKEKYESLDKNRMEILFNAQQEIEFLKEDNTLYLQALEEIREDMEQDITCESRECGCNDYAECLKCIKETILNKISEVLND